jgi:hypothetical protein
MTRVQNLQVKINELINNIIYIIIFLFKYLNNKHVNNIFINNVTTMLSCKSNHKTTMPRELLWMDETFM